MNKPDYVVGDLVRANPRLWKGSELTSHGLSLLTQCAVTNLVGPCPNGHYTVKLCGLPTAFDAQFFIKWEGVVNMEDEGFDIEAAMARSGGGNVPQKSTGGSSSYYDIEIPEELLDILIQRKKDGVSYIKTEEMINVQFGNDFDFGNAYKSLQRAYQAKLGGGKEGNTVEYEMNKIEYSVNKIRQSCKVVDNKRG